MSDELSFPMTEADLELASLARGMIRGYLDDRNLPAEDIIRAGRALYVFEQLPVITPKSSSQVSVTYSFGGESSSVNFSVWEECFEVTIGGSSNMGAGMDSYASGERMVWKTGDTEGHIELSELEQQIDELYRMGGEVRVEDETELGW